MGSIRIGLCELSLLEPYFKFYIDFSMEKLDRVLKFLLGIKGMILTEFKAIFSES